MFLLSSEKNITIVNKNSLFSGTVVLRSNNPILKTKVLYNLISNSEIICDYKDRYDVIRLGLCALYITFEDCYNISNKIKFLLSFF